MKMNEAYKELLQNVINADEYVIRGKKVRELLNYSFTIDPRYVFYDNEIRKFPWKYMYGELLWYATKSNNIKYIQRYSKFWKKITNPDGTVNSAYGYLIFTKFNGKPSSYRFALNALLADKYSRQSIIRYNRPEHEFEGNKDFVCTMYSQQFIRDNKLHMYVYMRSSDVIRGISFDIPWFSLVQQQMLLDLRDQYPDLELGTLTYTGGSVHVYSEHFDMVTEALEYPFIEQPPIILRRPFMIESMDNTYVMNDKLKRAYIQNDKIHDYKAAFYDLLS